MKMPKTVRLYLVLYYIFLCCAVVFVFGYAMGTTATAHILASVADDYNRTGWVVTHDNGELDAQVRLETAAELCRIVHRMRYEIFIGREELVEYCEKIIMEPLKFKGFEYGSFEITGY